jgi:hypothetical protein
LFYLYSENTEKLSVENAAVKNIACSVAISDSGAGVATILDCDWLLDCAIVATLAPLEVAATLSWAKYHLKLTNLSYVYGNDLGRIKN